MLREWWKSRKARYQADALREEVNAQRHARAKDLIAKPYKSLSEINELQLYENTLRISGLTDQSAMWRDRLDLMRPFDRGGLGGSGFTNHTNRRGADFPFFANEQELSMLRDASRLCVGTDPNAIGLMGGLTSYTVGKGSVVRVKPRGNQHAELAQQAQAVIDDFCDQNKWFSREEEYFRRTVRDGDAALRLFPDNTGRVKARFVWPEQIRQPDGTSSDEWAFGVKTDPDDVEDVQAFAIHPTEGVGDFTEVPAQNIVFHKINTDTGVRRGLPDFAFSTLDVLNDADKLCDNMATGSAIQAAIAYIRQHTGATRETLRAFKGENGTQTVPDPLTGKDRTFTRMTNPHVVDTNENTEFLASPYNAGISSHLEVAKMLWRRACARWNAPEWLGTSDASNNNYASSLTAESPFVLGIECRQEKYADTFRTLFQRVLAFAAIGGRLPQNILACVTVEVTFPSPVVRDRMQESQRSLIEIQGGWKSPQKAADEAGYDFAEVQRERAEAANLGWIDPSEKGG